MKRIAIISPCILPVPAIKGGAVEGLITRIIEDNEKYADLSIDLFCIDDGQQDQLFQNTHLIHISNPKFNANIDKALDAFYRRAQKLSSTRTLDKEIVKAFADRIQETKETYDAIIVQNLMSTALAVVEFCQGRFETPVFFHMHNCVDVYRSPEYVRKLVKNGVQFIAVSEYIKQEILECDRNATVEVLYNGTSLVDADRKDNIADTAYNYLYAGRIIPGKGVKELALAFESFLNKLDKTVRDKYSLDIIGFGDNTEYEKQVRATVKGFENNIRCLDKISASEVLRKYYEYDVVVMPTKNMEPFGLVALETISRGIPLITTNSGALPEVVGDGAIIVDKDNDFVNNLEQAIRSISGDKELREKIADIGYRRAREISEFNIDNYYKGFLDIIREQAPSGKVSVIVPVYNVEEYLGRCVQSIISQTYTDLEIILVDDGSKDGSGSLCDEYAKKDSRIRVIHQNNKGLSGARNSGLDIATGDYIFLCDSDDYLETCAIMQLLRKMKADHTDIVACGIKMVGDKTGLFTSTKPGMWSGHESVIQMMRTNNLCSVAWNKLYKKELFDGVRYPEGVLHEDEATTYKLLYRAKTVSYTPDAYYNYYQRNSSIMSASVSNRYEFFNDAIKNRVAYFADKNEQELVEHSRITLLEGLKYAYRNENDPQKKKALHRQYVEDINKKHAPGVCGVKKQVALLLWKFIKY